MLGTRLFALAAAAGVTPALAAADVLLFEDFNDGAGASRWSVASQQEVTATVATNPDGTANLAFDYSTLGIAAPTCQRPDGTTFLFHTSVLATEPSFKKNLPYDVRTDLVPLWFFSVEVQLLLGVLLAVTVTIGFRMSRVFASMPSGFPGEAGSRANA